MSSKINGFFPIVRCVCGRQQTLKRATVCQCGVTLRVKYGPGNVARPYGTAPDRCNEKARPYKAVEIVGWEG